MVGGCLLTSTSHLICQVVDTESLWYLHSYSRNKGEIVVMGISSNVTHVLEIGKEKVQVIHLGYLLNKLWNVFEKELWILIVKNVEIDTVTTTCNKGGAIVQSNDYR